MADEDEQTTPEDARVPGEDEVRALITTGDGGRRDAAADETILKHMGLAMGGGAIPVPVLDLAAVTAVQLDLLKRLAALYDVPFEARSSRAFLTSLTGALGAGALARVGASLAKAIPGVGTIGGGITQVVLTGATTYAVGQLFKRVFREGRTIAQLDVDDVREEAAGYLESGKGRARGMLEALRGRPRDE